MDIRTYALLAGASLEDASAAHEVYEFLATDFSEEKYYYMGLAEIEEHLTGRIGRVLAAALAYHSGITPEDKVDHSKQSTRFGYVYKALEEMKEVAEETTGITINVQYPAPTVSEGNETEQDTDEFSLTAPGEYNG